MAKYRHNSVHDRNTRGDNTSFKLNMLGPWEEIDGNLLSIVTLKGSTIVTLSKEFNIQLEDNEFAKNLRRLISKHIAILRTDEGYRFRLVKYQ